MDTLQIRTIGATLVTAGLISLLLIAVPWHAQGKGAPTRNVPTPALTPYPDPSRGGVGTWRP